MHKKQLPIIELTLDKIVGGGQTIGTLPDGRKCFVWGGLPGETVNVQLTKLKSRLTEGIACDILTPSDERVTPRDPESYLSTSPWQMMDIASESHYKAALIEEAFELHHVVLPDPIEVYTDTRVYEYRNKVEFSWFWDNEKNQLDLAFHRRGSHGKIPITGTSLARPEINTLACSIRDLLRTKDIEARNLKTLLIRCDQTGNCVWQLYVKDKLPNIVTADEAARLPAQGGEIILSDPRSPASRITERLTNFGDITLTDTILGVSFRYATESFFQVNLPIYEHALRDMKKWVSAETVSINSSSARDRRHATLDLYSGVGTIGLTIGGPDCTLVEVDPNAVREMKRNIREQGSSARAVLAASEKALDEITGDRLVILDPPRAGLHSDVIAKLLAEKPARIVYLSCNPVTQARDVSLLCNEGCYGIRAHSGYNFFPRTPHIEHLVVLDQKS